MWTYKGKQAQAAGRRSRRRKRGYPREQPRAFVHILLAEIDVEKNE